MKFFTVNASSSSNMESLTMYGFADSYFLYWTRIVSNKTASWPWFPRESGLPKIWISKDTKYYFYLSRVHSLSKIHWHHSVCLYSGTITKAVSLCEVQSTCIIDSNTLLIMTYSKTVFWLTLSVACKDKNTHSDSSILHLSRIVQRILCSHLVLLTVTNVSITLSAIFLSVMGWSPVTNRLIASTKAYMYKYKDSSNVK